MALTMLGRRMRSLGVPIRTLTKASNFPVPLSENGLEAGSPGAKNRIGLEKNQEFWSRNLEAQDLYQLRRQGLSFQAILFPVSPERNFHEPSGRKATAHTAQRGKGLVPKHLIGHNG